MPASARVHASCFAFFVLTVVARDCFSFLFDESIMGFRCERFASHLATLVRFLAFACDANGSLADVSYAVVSFSLAAAASSKKVNVVSEE